MEVWAKYGNDNVSNLYFSGQNPCFPFREESKKKKKLNKMLNINVGTVSNLPMVPGFFKSQVFQL